MADFKPVAAYYERAEGDFEFDLAQLQHDVHAVESADSHGWLSHDEVIAGMQGKEMDEFYSDQFSRMSEEEKEDAYNEMLVGGAFGDDGVGYDGSGFPKFDESTYSAYKMQEAAAAHGVNVKEYRENIGAMQERVFSEAGVELGAYEDKPVQSEGEKWLEAANSASEAKDDAAKDEVSEDEVSDVEAAEAEEVETEEVETEEGKVELEGVTATVTAGAEAVDTVADEILPDTEAEAVQADEKAEADDYESTRGNGTVKGGRPDEWTAASIEEYADKMKDGNFISEETADFIKMLAPVMEKLGIAGFFGDRMADAYENWSGQPDDMWSEENVLEAEREAYDEGQQAEAESGDKLRDDEKDAGEDKQDEQVEEAADTVSEKEGDDVAEKSGEEKDAAVDEQTADDAAKKADEGKEAAEDAAKVTEEDRRSAAEEAVYLLGKGELDFEEAGGAIVGYDKEDGIGVLRLDEEKAADAVEAYEQEHPDFDFDKAAQRDEWGTESLFTDGQNTYFEVGDDTLEASGVLASEGAAAEVEGAAIDAGDAAGEATEKAAEIAMG